MKSKWMFLGQKKLVITYIYDNTTLKNLPGCQFTQRHRWHLANFRNYRSIIGLYHYIFNNARNMDEEQQH